MNDGYRFYRDLDPTKVPVRDPKLWHKNSSRTYLPMFLNQGSGVMLMRLFL